MARERARKTTSAAPQHAAFQQPRLSDNPVEILVRLCVPHPSGNPVLLQLRLEIDPGIPPHATIAGKLPSITGDSTLKRKSRRKDAMTESAQASSELMRHVPT
jgi:hypothetical protein